MLLHNHLDRKTLKEQLHNEAFKRITISFYRYFYIENPQEFRDQIYREWAELNCFGRIYVAREGINAQMSVPQHHWDAFVGALQKHPIFEAIPIKQAVEDDGKSFYKLTIKVRPKLVADGLDADEYNVTNVGKHLTALEFHNLVGQPGTIVVDMRNHYESEVGHFETALCPDADTFREEIRMVEAQLQNQKDEKILLYCTGGIRCEKASAYLREKGFSDVNQLYGGIIEYAQQIKQAGLPSKFIGKNFVFDERLGERISNEVIARCHQCGAPCDTHTNCANNDCHLLFIQCPQCAQTYSGCCTTECAHVLHAPETEKHQYRLQMHQKYGQSQIYRSRLRPNLREITR